jgi:hypothetical protein
MSDFPENWNTAGKLYSIPPLNFNISGADETAKTFNSQRVCLPVRLLHAHFRCGASGQPEWSSDPR